MKIGIMCLNYTFIDFSKQLRYLIDKLLNIGVNF